MNPRTVAYSTSITHEDDYLRLRKTTRELIFFIGSEFGA